MFSGYTAWKSLAFAMVALAASPADAKLLPEEAALIEAIAFNCGMAAEHGRQIGMRTEHTKPKLLNWARARGGEDSNLVLFDMSFTSGAMQALTMYSEPPAAEEIPEMKEMLARLLAGCEAGK